MFIVQDRYRNYEGDNVKSLGVLAQSHSKWDSHVLMVVSRFLRVGYLYDQKAEIICNVRCSVVYLLRLCTNSLFIWICDTNFKKFYFAKENF